MDQVNQSWVSAPLRRPHAEEPSALGVRKVSLGSLSEGQDGGGVEPLSGGAPASGAGGGVVPPPPPWEATLPRIQLRKRSTRASTSVPPPAPELTATIWCGSVPGSSSGPPESPDSITSMAT